MSQKLEELNRINEQEMANMDVVQNELRQQLDVMISELKETRDLNHLFQSENAHLQQTVDGL